MGALTSYTISYVIAGTPGAPAAVARIYYKENADAVYTLAHTQNGVVPGNTYTYTFNNLNSHTVYQVRIESQCPGGGVQFGDVSYLSNGDCQDITVTVSGVSLNVTWDSYTPVNGDSVSQYKIEYKEVGSPGPYNIVTIPIATVLAYWAANPGSYPSFTQNLSTGIASGNTYEVNLYTTIDFDYILTPLTTTTPASIVVGPCTINSPLVP